MTDRDLAEMGLDRVGLEARIDAPAEIPPRVEDVARAFGVTAGVAKRHRARVPHLVQTCAIRLDRTGRARSLSRDAQARCTAALGCPTAEGFRALAAFTG